MPAIPRDLWPAVAAWIPETVPALGRAIAERACYDVGVCETPPGSNRSPVIDAWCKRAGSPVGSYWCACWATAVWEDCGAALPKSARGSCDVIRDWAEEKGLFLQTPVEGAFVVYGIRSDGGGWRRLGGGKPDCVHIGIVIRTLPYLISVEGNASWGSHSRNGEAVVVRRVEESRVLGYVHPIEE